MTKTLLAYLTHPHVGAWNLKSRHSEKLSRELPGYKVIVCEESREFLKRLPEAEVAVVWYFKKDWLASAPKLKLLATPAAGREWIDIAPNCRLELSFGSFHGPMIAESVVGAALYFCKSFRFSTEMQQQRRWEREKIAQKIASLHGARVTLLGFGNIGRAIGRALKPFGCILTGIKRTPAPAPSYFSPEDRIVTADRLSEELGTTDHLILALPGGRQTDAIFTRNHFQALPPHCFLYNIGRGNVYREDDLVYALRKGLVAGAYLDVFDREPLPEDSPLWAMNNVLIQPHVSAAAPHYLDLFVEELIGRIKALAI
ncbi:MAG: D-2-hydroxyacid dehydrogenase [Nitrospinales bacterium]